MSLTKILLSTLVVCLLISGPVFSAEEVPPEAETPVAEEKAAEPAGDEAAEPEKEAGDAADKKPEAADEKPDAESLFKDGRSALFQGNYDTAIDLLKKAVDADTKGQKTSYRLHLARAYRYAGKPEESEKLLNAIIGESPDHVEAGQLLAEILYGQERWKDIVKVLEPLLKFRHDYTTYHMLAEANYNLDVFDKARKYYKEAIRLNSASAPDHYQLANIYLADNRFALAVQSYERALRLGLESPVLHFKLASAYFNLRNYFGNVSVVTVAAGKPGTISKQWYLIERVPGKKDVFRVAPAASAIYQIAKATEGGEKWGFINRMGRWVVEPEYDEVGDFNEGFATVHYSPTLEDGKSRRLEPNYGWKSGLIDRRGREITGWKYDWIGDFSSSFAPVHIQDEWGGYFEYIDETGKVVTDLHAQNAGSFSEGYAIVAFSHSNGWVDLDGNVIWEPTW